MSTLFEYYLGSLEEFISQARVIGENRLMKTRLVPSSLPEYPDYWHVLDNFAVKHIMHRHSGKRERLRGQEPVTCQDLLRISDIVLNADTIEPIQCKNEVRRGHLELATTTMYKKKKLTDAKSPR